MISFALGSESNIEEKAITLYSSLNNISCKRYARIQSIPSDCIPIGSIEFFLKVSRFNVDASTYPDFLADKYRRRIWKTEKWPVGEAVFIKPATKLKRFTGFVTDGSYRGKKKGPYFCSEVINFENEWRYYITNGRVVGAWWYAGSDESAPPPDIDTLNINYPKNWVGSIDFGMTTDRGLVVVEAHEPFSVGWYGTLTNHAVYAEWIISGWDYLKTKYRSN